MRNATRRNSARSLAHQRGQGAVEFTLFTLAIVLVVIVFVQLAWIGLQKWQFNHFATYAARVWSVNKTGQSPEKILIMVQLTSELRWQLLGRDWVKYMYADSPETDSEGVHGVRYYGVVRIWPMFAPFLGGGVADLALPPAIKDLLPPLPGTGLYAFECWVPVDHEPDEDPDRWDNDCSDPCTDNGR